MTIEEVKEESKKRIDKDLTDQEMEKVARGVVPVTDIISEASRKRSFY